MTLATAGDDRRVVLWSATSGSGQRTLAALDAAVTCVAFAPEDRIAAGSADGAIRMWDAASAQLLATIAGHQGAVLAIVFYSDGRRFASCSADGTAKIWDLPTGRCLATMRPQLGALKSISVTPDSQTLAVAGYKVTLCDAVTGQQRCALEEVKGYAQSAAFAAAGRLLISGYDDGVIRLRRAVPR